MNILLIRHAESTGNAQRLWAGVTDHPLTLHGVSQAQALGVALKDTPLSHIFASPLSRAHETALAIRKHHLDAGWKINDELMEQHLGSAEGKRYSSVSRPRDGESRQAMYARARKFVAEQLDPLSADCYVAVVSHGLFLGSLITVLNIPQRCVWSNTGYSHLVRESPNMCRVVRENATDHLKGLKKGRGGISSIPYDKSQKKIKDFFKE